MQNKKIVVMVSIGGLGLLRLVKFLRGLYMHFQN